MSATTIIDRDHDAYDALTPSQRRRARLGRFSVELPPPPPRRPMSTVLLIDLSNLVHREFAVRGHDGDVHATATAVVAQVRRLASGQPHVAICCDSGKSFRRQIADDYKATRGERDPALYHQMQRAIETLRADGFPVWAVPEMEADDLIATAVTRTLAQTDAEGVPTHDVLIVSSDKDLTQLIGPFAQMKRPDTGAIVDDAAVREKFGVSPSQMRDYLTLVGDASDNIHGARKVGDKTARALLTRFGSLDELYTDIAGADALKLKALGITPALAESLKEFAARKDTVRQLVTLRTDVDIPFDEVFAPRVSKAAAEYDPEADYVADEGDPMPTDAQPPQPTDTPATETPVATGPIEPAETPATRLEERPATVTTLVPRAADAEPVTYERALDPRNMQDARILAKDLYQAAMFTGYGSPPAILTTVMLGRELGLPAMASLRGIHNIEGKHALSAQTMVALVLKSGFAEYFEADEFNDTQATYVTKRKGARKEQRVTHTIEMARAAFFAGRDPKKAEEAWLKSGWGKNPVDMLVARASSRLARLVYPDIVGGLYTPDELREARDAEAQAS